jgi:hypothetical protein
MQQAIQPTLDGIDANYTDAIEQFVLRQSGAYRRAQIAERSTIEGENCDIMPALHEPFGNGLQESLCAADERRVCRRDVDDAERTRGM